MSGYLPLNSTYSSNVFQVNLPAPGVAERGADCNLEGTINIVNQSDYIVGVHPNPFNYYALQHGLAAANAYFNIKSAYNGPCSHAAFRICTDNTVYDTLAAVPPTPPF
jgi:hypothetical protein